MVKKKKTNESPINRVCLCLRSRCYYPLSRIVTLQNSMEMSTWKSWRGAPASAKSKVPRRFLLVSPCVVTLLGAPRQFVSECEVCECVSCP